MKAPTRFLLKIFLFYLSVFAIGKFGFMLLNHASGSFNPLDMIAVWGNGLILDMATCAYLIIVPWVLCIVSVWKNKFPLRKWLIPYYIFIGVALTVVIAADAVLYEYWQFKIDSSVYNYLNADNGATESVTAWFIIIMLVAFFLFTTLIAYPAIKLTPKYFAVEKRANSASPKRRRWYATLGMGLIGLLMLLMTFGGRENGEMSVGPAYYSESLFLNHSAVNPLYSLMASTSKMRNFNEQFRYFSDEEAATYYSNLYPTKGATPEELTDSVLRTTDCNIITIQLESFCGKFIEDLGGMPGVCPNICRIGKESVWFENAYANSFRTDRGTVSVQSGYLSYPTATLFKLPEKHHALSSLARSLSKAGYTTDYTYGGDISFMGEGDYLKAMGFEKVISEPDFHITPEERSTWGVRDSLLFARTLTRLEAMPEGTRWYTALQTLDSHEPFQVPYSRLEDPVLNAFAYTDHCLGQFIDQLKKSRLWDNTLVIIFSDHGLMYQMNYENPEFFHIPMIWTGGAISEPKRISTLMNQSDLAATLLGQLGLNYSDYPWSRNVLSANYTEPFVYCNYPSGIMLKDKTGVSIYDTNAGRSIINIPDSGSELRIKRAKAILQKSYDHLQGL